jgi:cytochrome d ubiquinol oxidase subunit II
METLWFCLVALLITVYVILDGFDLGAGALHLFVARTDRERRIVLQSIGPVWDGNEVWLLAAGGSLVLAFPLLYASSFSGFYLPLMMVLWLLILRAISIEFRSHVDSPVWRPVWDVVFSASSLLLAVFFGAALGNVVRGVPLSGDGYFFNPLWTSFRIRGPEMGILDWYTVTVGVTSLLALTHHGALWLVLKTEDPIRERALRAQRALWPLLLAAVAMLTWLTFRVQPHVPGHMNAQPLSYVLPALALGGILGAGHLAARGRELGAFLASCLFLAGMLLSVAYGLYPMVLPASTDPAASLTVFNSHGPEYSLRTALWWWVPGMMLATAYTAFVYTHTKGKVKLDEEGY